MLLVCPSTVLPSMHMCRHAGCSMWRWAMRRVLFPVVMLSVAHKRGSLCASLSDYRCKQPHVPQTTARSPPGGWAGHACAHCCSAMCSGQR